MRINIRRRGPTLLVFATTAAGVFALASHCRADIAYTFTGGTQTSGQIGTYGHGFTPTQERIAVDSLGFFDFGIDGIQDHRVGIWTLNTGQLLASVTVTTANSTLAGPIINGGQYRFTPIAPLTLGFAGNYRLGAAIEGSSDIWYTGVTKVSNAPHIVSISNLNGVFTTDPFALPNTFGTNGSFAAASFTAYIILPEPTCAALCVMIGAVSAIVRRGRSARLSTSPNRRY